jgi:hypothetical protein
MWTTTNDCNRIFTHAFSQSSSKPHGKNGLARTDTTSRFDAACVGLLQMLGIGSLIAAFVVAAIGACAALQRQ